MHTESVPTETVDAKDVTPSQPEENLADVVTNLLASGGHPAPDAWKSHLHPDCYTGGFEVQRTTINNAWSHHLGLLASRTGTDTFNERYCLLDQGTRDQWIQNFTSGVLHTALKHTLPVSKKHSTTAVA